MLDIAWPELVIVGAVALVAIGPKDMPKAMHAMGSLLGKARRMMHVLSSQIDQLHYEAEMMESLRKQNQASEKQKKNKDPHPFSAPDEAGDEAAVHPKTEADPKTEQKTESPPHSPDSFQPKGEE